MFKLLKLFKKDKKERSPWRPVGPGTRASSGRNAA